MKTIIVNWETDGNKVDLPEEVKIPNRIDDEEISDWLSDKYGWLVNGWCEKEVSKKPEK